MAFNSEIHHRQSIRLRDYDYSQGGAYFVTICAFHRDCLFGEVLGNKMICNDVGKMVSDTWGDLPKRFPSLSLDEFVVMPNHFHGILVFDNVGAPLAAPMTDSAKQKKGAASSAPTLGDVLRAFKSISAISINRVLGRQGQSLWQRNYYERVIRDERELDVLRQYIADNPSRWEKDENHPSSP